MPFSTILSRNLLYRNVTFVSTDGRIHIFKIEFSTNFISRNLVNLEECWSIAFLTPLGLSSFRIDIAWALTIELIVSSVDSNRMQSSRFWICPLPFVLFPRITVPPVLHVPDQDSIVGRPPRGILEVHLRHAPLDKTQR